MRKLIIALALGAAAALPAIASEESYRLDEMAADWQATPAQTEWVDEPVAEDPDLDRAARAPIGVSRVGDGWPALDGWMRGDPTLRHWVMHRFDLDADGWLTTDEALMARRAFYQIADSNHSDRITSEEFVAGWSTVRQELRSFYAVGLGDA